MKRSNAPSRLGGTFSPPALGLSRTIGSAECQKLIAPVENAVRSAKNILELISKAKESVENEETSNSESQNSIFESEPSETTQLPVLSESSLNVQKTQTSKRVFNVVYGKPSKKKHKTWEGDGVLEIGEKSLTLTDCDGNILGRGSGKKNLELEEGSRLFVGSKEVEIIDAVALGAVAPSAKRLADVSPPQPKPKKAKSAGRLGSLTFAPPRKPQGATSEPCEPLVMPQPDLDHQWQYNAGGDPVSSVSVEPRLARVLRPHQRDGVVFLYRCLTGLRDPAHTGAILADEMGLGKTLQCVTIVWTLMHHGPYGRPMCRRVLIVAPSSLTANWRQEFTRWLGQDRILLMVIDQKNKPRDFQNQPNVPVMIISYEMFVRYFEDVSKVSFDLLICDEGHRLKNTSNQTYTLLTQLACPRKIILTGTPVQNHLQEFFALVDFVNPNILGSYQEFKKEFEEPIVTSRQPEADAWSRGEGKRVAGDLARLTSGFVLRRTHEVIDKYLPTKTEAVLFCRPSPLQRALYEAAVSCWEDADRGVSHLGVITTLRKISSHPALLGEAISSDDEKQDYLTEFLGCEYRRLSEGRVTVEDSSKLSVVTALLHSTAKTGERVVLVSYFTQTLDLLEALCDQYGWQHCRLDGSTPAARRNDIVNNFNSPHSNNAVFLLSARAGGVGLNLTGASRLVLYDSDWNPASDLQAMSRVWRDGQSRSVTIYRLLTTGSIEEKIFQRQLSKAGLNEAVVDPNHTSSVRLSDAELKDLFCLDSMELESDCLTHERLPCHCGGSGSAPRPMASTAAPRPCQLLVSGPAPAASSLRINQLFQWQHYAPPMPPELLQEMGVQEASHLITFLFRNVCDVP